MINLKTKSLHHIVIEGCDFNTRFYYNLNTNHIGIRTSSQYQKQYRNDNKDKIKEYQKKWRKNNRNKIKKYYENSRDSNTLRLGSKEHSIMVSCRQHGIDIKDFNGFSRNQKYCYKFNETLKQQIRNKYNDCDYISGLHKNICNKRVNLDVHHVDYDKEQGCGKNFNLIPLNKSNHSKTNKNRYFWNKLFIYSLGYDNEYYK